MGARERRNKGSLGWRKSNKEDTVVGGSGRRAIGSAHGYSKRKGTKVRKALSKEGVGLIIGKPEGKGIQVNHEKCVEL